MAELENPKVLRNLITFLSSLILNVAESNDINSGFQTEKMSVFHGLTRPTISIHSYLHRIHKYANCSTSCFVVAYVYLDRYYNNAYYAKVGGISTAEMNMLEVDFLFGLGFNLNVNPKTFETYYSHLQREMLMLLQPPPPPPPPPSSAESSMKLHLCFNEEEPTNTSHRKEQLAV
ncbi:Cyclin-U4-1 [Hibiscus syriacus]|uniref:Cyclin-U4-1 n=1 Tax=Hibiscus syriacus TaxID=106335 RepID=A0A6A2ZYG9_HIBSY|nr:Cyclin-U4-1 [Hibiscus syriacus]